MVIVLIVLAVASFFVFLTLFYGVKYRNPYKLIMVFGKKGSGKTTFLTKLAYEFVKKGGVRVYCTDPTIANTYTFNPKDLGTFDFEENSLVLIDEVSLIWSNRDFKSFSRSVDRWFRLMRHKRCSCYMFSQTFDVDKKIRDLVDGMYLMTKKFNCIAWAKQISKSMVLTEAEGDQPSSIAENLHFVSFLLWPFGSRIFTWIPKYSKMFDSFADQRSDLMPAQFTFKATPSRGRVEDDAFPLSAEDEQILKYAPSVSEGTRVDLYNKQNLPKLQEVPKIFIPQKRE